MKKQNHWLAGLLGAILTLSGTVEAVDQSWRGVNVSGVRSIYHSNKPEEVTQSKVYFSKGGTRIEQGAGLEQRVSIINLMQKKCYFLRPTQKTFIEVAFDPKTNQCAKMEVEGFAPELEGMRVLGSRPCFGYKGIKLVGEDRVVGRRTSRWQCIGDPEGVAVQHWFDFNAHVVVREMRGDVITEATHIELSRQIDQARLQPPADYTQQKP